MSQESIRQHTSAYVSIRRHTSAHVSIPAAAHVCRRKAKRPANSSHRHGLVPLCRVRAWDERHLRRVSISICTFVPVKQVNLGFTAAGGGGSGRTTVSASVTSCSTHCTRQHTSAYVSICIRTYTCSTHCVHDELSVIVQKLHVASRAHLSQHSGLRA